MLENSRQILTKVENRTNSLSIIYLAHKQSVESDSAVSRHNIQGSKHAIHRLIWYNYGITIRRLFMSITLSENYHLLLSPRP